ncbi:hypothetical protein ACHAXR_001587 [Thalassiosira sp. AJA248-18]
MRPFTVKYASLFASLRMPEPLPSSPAHSLYHLISQNRACKTHGGNDSIRKSIPLAGVHDALSAKIFAQNGAPALFLSGFGVSASLLGLPDAGMLNLVEQEMMARNVCSAVQSPDCHNIIVEGCHRPPPIFVDGDTGYGGASNMIRTISSLASAGAAAITIEDQQFPKKCTIAAGSKIRIVDRVEAVQRVKGALGARNLYNERSQIPSLDNSGAGPWIVARTDCRMAYGFQEVIERCLHFEELGAEIIYAEALQSREEYMQLKNSLDSRTVTMVAQVQESMGVQQDTDKPLLTVQEIGELGFDLALFGVTPLQCVVGALESAARNFLGGNDHEAMAGTGIIGYDKKSEITMADFATVKRVVGFDELEDFETKYPIN